MSETVAGIAFLIAMVCLLALTLAVVIVAIGLKRALEEAKSLFATLNRVGIHAEKNVQSVGRSLEQVEKSVGQLSEHVGESAMAMSRILARADRATSHLDSKVLANLLVRPVVATAFSWLSGARKAISALRHSPEKEEEIE